MHAARPAIKHLLGPFIWSESGHGSATRRLVSGLILAGCAAIFALAAWVKPDPAGFGSHRQLGFPPCPMPMMTGLPCPTCGMTTAVAHAVRGHLVQAFVAQPAGLAAAFGVAGAAIVAGFTLVTGRVVRFNWYRIRLGWTVFGGVGCVLASWAFKIATMYQTSTGVIE